MVIPAFIKKILSKDKEEPCISAVILAAGNSTRMGEDKIRMEIGGIPVLVRTLNVFEKSDVIKEIIVVTGEDKIESTAAVIRDYNLKKVKAVIAGGSTRAESSLAGLCSVDRKIPLAAIHDCARPFVTPELIYKTACAARDFNAAAPALKCTDTLKLKTEDFMFGTIDRDTVCAVQTPQIFQTDIIKGALTYALKNKIAVTDDTSAAALLGFRTKIVEGDSDNIKLTTQDDIFMAEYILKKRGGNI